MESCTKFLPKLYKSAEAKINQEMLRLIAAGRKLGNYYRASRRVRVKEVDSLHN